MWSNIIGQERAKEIFKNIYLNKKISHAYIIHGNEGTGKDAFAIEFAKLLNCDSPVNGNEACDICKSCIEIEAFRSPLFKYIIALPSGKNETEEDSNPLEKLDKEDYLNYLNEINSKVNDKYHKISLAKANDIRINSIRQIKREIYMTGKVGKKKVYVISKCDMMNQQSANSILKVLEEPPKDSVIMLTTSKLNSLLPTIIGRCQKFKFDNIRKELLIKYIKQKNAKIPLHDIEFFAELSNGSITRCNEILRKNFLELREKVWDLLILSSTNQNLRLGNNIDFIIGKKDKERVKQFLIILCIWFRDIINKSMGNDHLIINKDKTEMIGKFVATFESQNYKIINCIEEAIIDLESNIFLDLLLYNLTYKINSFIKKKTC